MKNQSRAAVAWACRKEYARKAGQIVALIVAYCGIVSLVALALSAVYPPLRREDVGVARNVWMGVGLICGFSNDVVEGQWLACIYGIRAIWLFVSFFLSAFAAMLCSQPINPIAIAPCFVANTDGDRLDALKDSERREISGVDSESCHLEFRYWLRVPDGVYLYQVSCLVEITTRALDTSGVNRKEPLYEHSETYTIARGVRVFRVRLGSASLKKALNKMLSSGDENDSKNAPFIRFRVMGLLSNGRSVVAAMTYRPEHFRNGYRFASIRKSSCLGISLHDLCESEYLLDAHFTKLYKCYNGCFEGLPCRAAKENEVVEWGSVSPCKYDRLRYCLRIAFHPRCFRMWVRKYIGGSALFLGKVNSSQSPKEKL